MNIHKLYTLLLFCVLSVKANFVSYTNTLPSNFDYTESTVGRIQVQHLITLPQWDSQLFQNSTLVNVSYQMRGFYSFNYFVETGPNTFGNFEFGYENMYMQLTGPFSTSPTVYLTQSEFGGSYYTNFSNVSPLTTISGTSGLLSSVPSNLVYDTNVSNYVGTGTLSFLVNESALISISGTASGFHDISYTQGASKYNAMQLVINYEYYTIPEPSSIYGLLAIVTVLSVYSYNKVKIN